MRSKHIAAIMICIFSMLATKVFAFYNPQTGHWLTRDPIAESGGININSFSWNSPVTFVDIDGLQMFELAPVTAFTRFGPLTEFSEMSEPVIRISGSPGETITGTSRPSLQQIPDAVLRPVGSGLLPPVAVTVPQPGLQPQPSDKDTKPKPQQDISPKNPDLLYRAMQKWGNSPGVGESARLLGVRPNPPINENYDVRLDGEKVTDFDTVKRSYQGMSVAPESPLNLPFHRLTRGLGLINRLGKPGEGRDPIWEIPQSAIFGKLKYLGENPGAGQDSYHGFIVPAYCMKYDEYKQAIENTRPLWKPTHLTPYIRGR